MADKTYVIIHSLKSKMPRRLIIPDAGQRIDPAWADPGEGMIVVTNPTDTTDMFGMARMIAAHHQMKVEDVTMPNCACIDPKTSRVAHFIAADADIDTHVAGLKLVNCGYHIREGYLHDVDDGGRFKKRLVATDPDGRVLRERWVLPEVIPTGRGGAFIETEDHSDAKVGDVIESRRFVRNATAGVRTL